jgi:hypothetical protein
MFNDREERLRAGKQSPKAWLRERNQQLAARPGNLETPRSAPRQTVLASSSSNPPQKIADTIGLAGQINDVFEEAPKMFAALTGPEDMKAAKHFAKKITGGVGKLLSLGEAEAQYRADRARGVPEDEALLNSYGGMGLGYLGGALGGLAGGAIGSLAGAPGTAIGVGAGTLGGAYVGGEYGGPFLARGLREAKETAGEVRDEWRRGIVKAMNPYTYVRPPR